MLLVSNGRRYVLECTYEERDIPRRAGFHWDSEDKVWWTENKGHALSLREYADDETMELLMPGWNRERLAASKGYKDGYDAGHQAGYKQGYEDGVEFGYTAGLGDGRASLLGTSDPEFVRHLIQLCHPDRHPKERQQLANRVTARLLEMRSND